MSDDVIRVYDAAGNVIQTHEHNGDFKDWRFFTDSSVAIPSSQNILLVKFRIAVFLPLLRANALDARRYGTSDTTLAIRDLDIPTG